MLGLLTKLKEGCHNLGIDLISAEINGDCIKLYCTVNGQRNSEINAYVEPNGNGFNFYTVTPQGIKSEPVKLDEEKSLPTLLTSVKPDAEAPAVEEPENEEGEEIVVIEVEDGVFDEKKCRKGAYKNSRYAYSDKYHKMGTITEIRQIK
jgi:hypothetical protein